MRNGACRDVRHKLAKRLGELGSRPQLRRGGRDIKKKTAQPPLMERTGWCWSKDMCDFLTSTTPSALNKDASLLFFDRAATPPRLRRGAAHTRTP